VREPARLLFVAVLPAGRPLVDYKILQGARTNAADLQMNWTLQNQGPFSEFIANYFLMHLCNRE
jgi:hypothetical protein